MADSAMTATMKSGMISVALSLIVLQSVAEEWQWHRIAWEGFSVGTAISPPDSGDVIYATLNERWPMEDEGVYKSYDDGLTWRYFPESYNPSCNILTLDPNNAAIVYCGSAAFNFIEPEEYPKRSIDAGEHWEVFPVIVDRMVPSPWTEGLILGTGLSFSGGWILWKSEDDGETWTALSGSEVGGITDNVIFHLEDSTLVFAGYISTVSDPDGLAKSSDDGDTWEVVLGGVICSFDQDPANSSHWIAMKAYHDVYSEPAYFAESFDNGETWELWPLPEPIRIARELLFDLFDSQVIYMTDSRWTVLGVYRSTDGGHTWEPMNEGFDPVPQKCHLLRRTDPPGELFAATSTGLWLWTDEQHGPGPMDVAVRTLRLEWIRPCPFREQMQAQLVVGRRDVVRAQVYSISGSAVRTLLERCLEPDVHSLSWDGRDCDGKDVAPGAYMLSVQISGERAIRRMVKVE